MTNLREAINHYHSLLDDETGRLSHGQLKQQLNRRNLFFGDRPLCTVLRPRFLTHDQYRQLQSALTTILPAFRKAYQAAMDDAKFREQFKLSAWEEKLIQVDPGFKWANPTGRMDTFFTDANTLFLTEYNGETPAAPAYNDVLSEVFYGLSIMREFEKQYEVSALPARHHTLHALLDCFEQWGGRSVRPRIAILDWREVPTYSEFVLFQQYFESQGYECLIADPRDCEYRNGELLVDGVLPVNLIYKRVLLSELVERCGVDNPVIQAVSERAACMVNPFRCKILHKKTGHSVLSDEANAHLFTPEERQAIEAYIPWTRTVAERKTLYRGEAIDLLPYISQNKDNYVLKPTDEYGGKGIVLGWEADQAQWDETIKVALAEPYIVQQRVNLPSEPYPSLVEGRVQVYDRMLDTNPYMWYGEYMSGCLTRLSTAALLNVTAGGGSTVPTFIVEKRK